MKLVLKVVSRIITTLTLHKDNSRLINLVLNSFMPVHKSWIFLLLLCFKHILSQIFPICSQKSDQFHVLQCSYYFHSLGLDLWENNNATCFLLSKNFPCQTKGYLFGTNLH
jgi:hypothetical protein